MTLWQVDFYGCLGLPPVRSFETENIVVASLFDGWGIGGVRGHIQKLRAACDEMEAKLNEWDSE